MFYFFYDKNEKINTFEHDKQEKFNKIIINTYILILIIILI